MSIARRTLAAILTSFILLILGASVEARAPQECKDAGSCRQLATEAKERKDYDAFHDLAWKAMNLGPKNDAAAMTLLARAQSLSGRPLDAIVMLQRLAAMGVFSDAATSDDFERVRALPSWSELEAKLSGKGAPVAAAPPPAVAPPETAPASKPKPTSSEKTSSKADATEKTSTRIDKEKTPKVEPLAPVKAPPPPVKGASEAAAANAKTAKASAAPPEPLRFAAAGLTAVGLAYDAVSGRFIVGDRAERRLIVVGERSGRVASLAGVDAGLNELTALEIDAREGDLWVVSANGGRSSTVHKLQLISGRTLASIAVPEDLAPARFTDVAVTPQSILVLDSEGRRIFRAAKKGRTLEVAMRLAVPAATVLAPVSDALVYVAFDRGLLRADLAARSMSVVEAPPNVNLTGISWMRPFRGSLVALQPTAEGTARLVRIRIDDGGRTVRGIDVLDENIPIAGPTSAAITDNAVYYLNRAPDSGDVIVRKVPLK
jgi:hypothetical protein